MPFRALGPQLFAPLGTRLARLVAQSLGLIALFVLSSAPMATADDVAWSADIDLRFTPEQVKQGGGEQALRVFQDALAARLQKEGVASNGEPLEAGESGARWGMSLRGRGGLSQFKQTMFADLEPVGGLLGGSASLALTGDLRRGETLSFVLESNLATGFKWELEGTDPASIEPVGEAKFEPKTNLLGAPMKQRVTLRGLRDGVTTLRLSYRRSFESDPQPTRRITIRAPRLLALTDLTNPVPPQSRPEWLKTPSSAAASSPATAPLPSYFSWKDLGKVTPVRDQGGCGSCWAFATVGVFESDLLIQDDVAADLSEQYLISCNDLGWGCSGGWWAHDYHSFLKPSSETDSGAVPESSSPYLVSDAQCRGPYHHPYRIDSWSYIGDWTSIASADKIKQAIYNYGPVATTVCVGPKFQVYGGGVFSTDESSTCGGSINHAVVLVGWNDADGTWLMRNSWGSSWGEQGYMRIARNVSNVGLATNYVIYNGVKSNDDFDHATPIGETPFVISEDISRMTTAVDDPALSCAGGQGASSVWFKYTPSTSWTLNVSTNGSDYDTVLGIWKGPRGNLTRVECDDDAAGHLTSELGVRLVAGTTYYIEVARLVGAFKPDVTSPQGTTLQLSLSYASDLPAIYLPLILSRWAKSGAAPLH